MGKYGIALLGICGVLIGMDDPAPYNTQLNIPHQSSSKKEDSKKKKESYLKLLPSAVGIQIMAPYLVSVKEPRDNRRDYIIEQSQQLEKSNELAGKVWGGSIDEVPIVDGIVEYMKSHPAEESYYRPNALSVTSSLPLSQEKMKKRLLQRMPQFGSLPQKDKDAVVVDAIKVCPDLEVIKPMIEGGATIHAQDASSRSTLLHFASRAGKADLVKFLLESKATVDPKDRLEATPLHEAVHNGHLEVAKLLLEHKSQVNLWDWSKNNALYYVVLYAVWGNNLPMVQLLLNNGATIYYSDSIDSEDSGPNDDIFQKNVLALAAAHNNIPMLKLLIENKKPSQPFLDLFEHMINASLCVAASKGYHEVVDYLLSYADFMKSRPRIMPDFKILEYSAIGYALFHNHFWLAYKLITCGNNEHYTPQSQISRRECLRIAIEKICELERSKLKNDKMHKKLKAIIKIFLKEKIEPTTGARPSASFIAAKYQNIPWLKKLLDQSLENGDSQAPNKLMFEAVDVGCAPAVHSLLQEEIAVPATIADVHGNSLLHKAVLILDEPNLIMIDILIACGADIGAKNTMRQETPLHCAMRHPNKQDKELVVKKIVQHMQKQNCPEMIDAVNKVGNTPLMDICAVQNDAAPIINLLIENGAKVNMRNAKGQTALFIAAAQNSLENVEALLEADADPNAINNDGCGPLTKAARNGNFHIINALLKKGGNLKKFMNSMLREAAKGGHLQLIDWLLNNGADINGKSTSFGNTPLHKAVQYRQYDAIEFLLKKGADVFAQNAKHNIPLDYAIGLPDTESDKILRLWMRKKIEEQRKNQLPIIN